MALTLTTENEIVTAAGVGASTAITLSSAWLILIGTRAEGEFCSDTGINWVTDFANLNTQTKAKINKAVASRAAMDIANYDATGYFTKTVQETVLDVNNDNYERAVTNLSKLNKDQLRSVTD